MCVEYVECLSPQCSPPCEERGGAQHKATRKSPFWEREASPHHHEEGRQQCRDKIGCHQNTSQDRDIYLEAVREAVAQGHTGNLGQSNSSTQEPQFPNLVFSLFSPLWLPLLLDFYAAGSVLAF